MPPKYCPYCGYRKIIPVSIIGNGCTEYFCLNCKTRYDLRKRKNEI